jgi:proteasome accessory factor B
MQRLERLINLTATLLASDRLLTAAEIYERVPGYEGGEGSVRRAFERDKEVLRELGVPVDVELLVPGDPASGEGYRIRRDEYELPDPGLTPDELAALHLAASTVRLEGVGGTEALWKLGGATATARPAAPSAALPGSTHLPTLFQAVAERRVVAFTYRGERRDVEPWRLTFRSGHWYLVGRDRARDGRRSYRLDRFESDVATEVRGGFVPPAEAGEPATRPFEMGEEEPVTATVLVDAVQAGWAVSHLGDDAVVERRGDGAVVLGVRVTNRAAFRSFVLGFLDHAEVLGPPPLRAEMVSWLEAMCRR